MGGQTVSSLEIGFALGGIPVFILALLVILREKYVSFMGLRYLWKWVNLISVLCVTIGVMALIVVLSVFDGFHETLRQALRENSCDLILTPSSARASFHYDGLKPRIEKVEHVQASAPRVRTLVLGGMPGGFKNPDDNGAILFGVNPSLEFRTTEFKKILTQVSSSEHRVSDPENPFHVPAEIQARYGLERPGILVGEYFFKWLGLRKWDDFTVVTLIPSEADRNRWVSRSLACVIAGGFQAGMYEYNQRNLYMDIDVVRTKLLGMERGECTHVYVRLDDYQNVPGAKTALAKAGGCFVQTWEEEKGIFLRAVGVEKRIMTVILFFIILVAGFSILAILSMKVVEKTKDIGILKSLGSTTRGILSIFLLYGTAIGVVGSLLGMAAGLALSYNLNWIHDNIFVPILRFPIFSPEIYAFDEIPVNVQLFAVFLTVEWAIAISLIASLYPAFRAARFDPVKALRYE